MLRRLMHSRAISSLCTTNFIQATPLQFRSISSQESQNEKNKTFGPFSNDKDVLQFDNDDELDADSQVSRSDDELDADSQEAGEGILEIGMSDLKGERLMAVEEAKERYKRLRWEFKNMLADSEGLIQVYVFHRVKVSFNGCKSPKRVKRRWRYGLPFR